MDLATVYKQLPRRESTLERQRDALPFQVTKSLTSEGEWVIFDTSNTPIATAVYRRGRIRGLQMRFPTLPLSDMAYDQENALSR